MNAATSMFVLSEGGLVPLQPATFSTEAEFQALLADHPALLAGDQIDSASPCRFLLIDREQPIACEQNGPARMSCYPGIGVKWMGSRKTAHRFSEQEWWSRP